MSQPHLTAFPLDWVRAAFPQLRPDHAFLDNAAGSFLPRHTIDAMTQHLTTYGSVNIGTHEEGQAMLALKARARAATALFLNAEGGDVAFGPSTTAMTFRLSATFARLWGPGDEIVVSELEHESDVSPWRELERQGVTVRTWPARLPDMSLHVEDLRPLLNSRTRLLAMTASSNALGVQTPVKAAVAAAHEVGAWTIVDNVHGAAHHLPDAHGSGTDFMTFSPYKVLAPHLGVLYVRPGLLETLPVPKMSFIASDDVVKLEYGTPPYATLAAWLGALTYLTELGGATELSRAALEQAYAVMGEQEEVLKAHFLAGLRSLPWVILYGPQEGQDRAATFAFRVVGHAPDDVTAHLRQFGVSVTSGHSYAVEPLRKLGLLPEGIVRASFAHYTTVADVDRLLRGLAALGEHQPTQGVQPEPQAVG